MALWINNFQKGGDQNENQACPARSAGSQFAHENREQRAHHDRTGHRDNAAVAGNLFQQNRVVGECADRVRIHCRIAHRGKNAEGSVYIQKIHTTFSVLLHAGLPENRPREQSITPTMASS